MKKDGGNDDSLLIARVLSGNERDAAFETLVDKYWRLVVAWIRPRVRCSAEAEEVTQDTFIRAFRSLGTLQHPARFLNWLLKIARNLAADCTRRRHEVQSLDRLCEDGRSPEIPQAPVEDIGEKIDRSAEYEAVMAAVQRLPEKYRLVIMLRYFEGFSGNQISTILGEPEGTIRNRLFRAHEKVRRLLGGPLPGAEDPAKAASEGGCHEAR